MRIRDRRIARGCSAHSWLLLCSALLIPTSAASRTEYHLGGPDGNRWRAALGEESAGRYQVFDSAGQILRSVPVAITPYGAGTDTLIDFTDTAIQARYIDPAVNLLAADPETNLASGSTPIRLPLSLIHL